MTTEAEKHRRWLAARKAKIEEAFPDICTCYLSKPFARQRSCKNCQMCPGCGQHIRNDCWDDHAESCRALNELVSVATLG